MCGIVGYKGYQDASMVVDALRCLEYRGYDSWGIATIDIKKIRVFKQEGKIGNVTVKDIGKGSGITIGHTRWATHGAVSVQNAHPILSQDNKIAVAHNGIIENYTQLRRDLEKHGISFQTQTDTEVIPNLIQLYMTFGDDFATATRKAILRLEGSYAIVAIHQDFDELFVARNGSPLVLGISGNEYFAASDVTAFLDKTRTAVYLEDGEYAVIGSDLCVKKIVSNVVVNPLIQEITWDLAQASKAGYPHFMIKEILEQPQSIGRSLLQDATSLSEALGILKHGTKIYMVACGSSLFAAEVGKYWFSQIAQQNVETIVASEFENFGDLLKDGDVIISLSQSGETADTIGAVKLAKKKGVRVVSIINSMGSTLSRISDATLSMNCGPEICVLSTKSFTAELGVLNMLIHTLAGSDNNVRSVIPIIETAVLRNSAVIADLALALREKKDMFVLGRGVAFPCASEGALKIKEVSYIHAEGFCGGELKHGSIALIEKGSVAIALVTPNTRRHIQSNCMEIRCRGGIIIAIDSEPSEAYDHLIQIPQISEELYPFVVVILLQLFSYRLAVARDCDPDKPRNLAKSVTVK